MDPSRAWWPAPRAPWRIPISTTCTSSLPGLSRPKPPQLPPNCGLGEADVLVVRGGKAEGAEVGQGLLLEHELGPLVEREGVDLLPDLGVDLVAERDGLLGVQLSRGPGEERIDGRGADPRVVLVDVDIAAGLGTRLR